MRDDCRQYMGGISSEWETGNTFMNDVLVLIVYVNWNSSVTITHHCRVVVIHLYFSLYELLTIMHILLWYFWNGNDQLLKFAMSSAVYIYFLLGKLIGDAQFIHEEMITRLVVNIPLDRIMRLYLISTLMHMQLSQRLVIIPCV